MARTFSVDKFSVTTSSIVSLRVRNKEATKNYEVMNEMRVRALATPLTTFYTRRNRTFVDNIQLVNELSMAETTKKQSERTRFA